MIKPHHKLYVMPCHCFHCSAPRCFALANLFCEFLIAVIFAINMVHKTDISVKEYM